LIFCCAVDGNPLTTPSLMRRLSLTLLYFRIGMTGDWLETLDQENGMTHGLLI
jgi:hypothetical protein